MKEILSRLINLPSSGETCLFSYLLHCVRWYHTAMWRSVDKFDRWQFQPNYDPIWSLSKISSWFFFASSSIKQRHTMGWSNQANDHKRLVNSECFRAAHIWHSKIKWLPVASTRMLTTEMWTQRWTDNKTFWIRMRKYHMNNIVSFTQLRSALQVGSMCLQ